MLIPLPPLPEQRRIAAKIQELIQDLDDARAACEKQLEAAKALPAAYLRSAFETEEAKKWEKKKLGEVCKILTGSTPRTDDPYNWDGDMLWGTPNDMGKLTGFTIDDTERKITEKALISCSMKILPSGSVLLTTRAPIGHIAINLKPMCTNQGFKSLIPSSGIHNWFLLYAIKYCLPVLKLMGRGQTFAEISKEQVSNFEISFPSFAQQRLIATKIQVLMQEIDLTRTSCEKQLKTISYFPDIILNKAFRREIRN